MKIERLNADERSVQVTEDDLRIMLAAMREVIQAIDDFEFYARIGAQKADVHKVCAAMKQQVEAASIEI